MKERPILFSGPMVRAILDGRKTQTRRLLTPQPSGGVRRVHVVVGKPPPTLLEDGHGRAVRPRYGMPGDRFWVRETWCIGSPDDKADATLRGAAKEYAWRPLSANGRFAYYAATDHDVETGEHRKNGQPRSPWVPSIYMPRWASRLTMEVVAVRVERLQSITEADARAEGVRISDAATAKQATVDVHGMTPYRGAFASLWDSINGHRAPWSTDPWVWVVEFRAVRP